MRGFTILCIDTVIAITLLLGYHIQVKGGGFISRKFRVTALLLINNLEITFTLITNMEPVTGSFLNL